MQKIVFEDTEVTKQPYVEINNIEYEVQDGTYVGGTDLDADTFNTMQDNIEDAIKEVQNVELIAISDVEPSECTTGDKYYNTEDNLIYTATGTNTWSEIGVQPIKGIFYILFSEQSSYSYDGTTLVSVGGGTEDIVISDEEPTEEGVKIWIDTGEISNRVSEITNEYSTSTGIGYSANYVNNMRKVLWTNSSPTSNFISQNVAIEDMSSYDYYEIIYKIWTGSNYQHSTGLIQKGASAFLSGIEITPSSNVGAYQSRKVDYNSSTELHFNDCYVENVYTNASTTISTSNNIMIPMQIIGHKF